MSRVTTRLFVTATGRTVCLVLNQGCLLQRPAEPCVSCYNKVVCYSDRPNRVSRVTTRLFVTATGRTVCLVLQQGCLLQRPAEPCVSCYNKVVCYSDWPNRVSRVTTRLLFVTATGRTACLVLQQGCLLQRPAEPCVSCYNKFVVCYSDRPNRVSRVTTRLLFVTATGRTVCLVLQQGCCLLQRPAEPCVSCYNKFVVCYSDRPNRVSRVTTRLLFVTATGRTVCLVLQQGCCLLQRPAEPCVSCYNKVVVCYSDRPNRVSRVEFDAILRLEDLTSHCPQPLGVVEVSARDGQGLAKVAQWIKEHAKPQT